MKRLVLVSFLWACGDNVEPIDEEPIGEEPIQAVCNEAQLDLDIKALPNVKTAVATPCGNWVEGVSKCFRITIEQPVNQLAPDKVFEQHLWLMHRGCDRPTVVADWGYSNEYFFDDELAVLFDANALWVEHRFQGESLPALADWDWKQLTIENGAHDLHDVITSFKHLYGGRWVSTGASKGGITATYHAYFFPDDLDGVIPYVAPASRWRVDAAYQSYIASVMSRSCGQRVRDSQVAALTTRRPMMLAKIGEAVGTGYEELYLEAMTTHFDWAFWQYYGDEYCSQVPEATATDEQFWNFYAAFSGLFGPQRLPGLPANEAMSDGALYYEWLTEQGFALQIGEHVKPLLQNDFATATMEDRFRAEFPAVELPTHDGSVTRSVRRWASLRAENIMFIYGQFDPWSGGAIDEPVQPSSSRFFVPGANHGAQISGLDAVERNAALAHAERMFGRPPMLTEMPRAIRAGKTRDAILARTMQRALVRMP